jgi:Fe-S-cluster-containing dehydrogenase component/formate-dependent nitrite reductase membrane component NrfD
MNYGFIIDNRKCIGCHACTVACKAEHEVPVGVNRTWVKYIEKGTFPDTRRLFSVMRCNHCADAPCVEICPVTALFTRKDGIVDFDDRRCIGCKACTQACPYDAIYMHPDDHTSAKCNYCTHRVDIGLEPACVNVCPEHAIISGDMDNPSSEISQLLARETVSVRKPEKGTNPKLFYIDGDKASLDPTAAHPDSDYMWSSQRYGVGHYARFTEAKARAGNAGSSPPARGGVAEGRGGGSARNEPEGRRGSLPIHPSGRTATRRNGGDARETRALPARRVYDAPGKGVVWGWEVSAYVWTKAISAGIFLMVNFLLTMTEVPILLKMAGNGIALFFLGVTGVLLIKDLGRPERFIYTLLRPQWRSWLTRGSYIITAYGAVLTAWWVAVFLKQFHWLGLIEWLGLLPALMTAVYTAFLFAQAKGRDFWQSPMLSIHMVLHSLIAGGAALLISDVWFDWNKAWTGPTKALTGLFIILNLLTIAIELATTHATSDAATVAKMITRGQFKVHFWVGMILLGNVLPLAVMVFATVSGPVAAVVGLVILIGLYIGEHIWVKAPQLVPLS